MALMAAPKRRQQEVEVAAAPEAVEPAKPAVVEEAAPAPKAEKTAAPAKEEAAVERTEESFEPERKCKYKIPYVGRVISVPCRD